MQVWKYEYDCPYTVSYPAGPRCTPTVSGGKVYTLGSEGNLNCLDAKTGKPLWSKDFNKEFNTQTPLWGYTGHPLVDGKNLICLVGGKDALLVAFDKDTGKEVWKSLNAAQPGYCPPSIITAGGKRQLLIWEPEKIHSVDPETGKPFWSVELGVQFGMTIMSPRKSGNYLFAGGYGPVGRMLELDGVKEPKEIWRSTMKQGIGPVNATPLVEGETMYGVDQPGQLRAVGHQDGQAASGRRSSRRPARARPVRARRSSSRTATAISSSARTAC